MPADVPDDITAHLALANPALAEEMRRRHGSAQPGAERAARVRSSACWCERIAANPDVRLAAVHGVHGVHGVRGVRGAGGASRASQV
jgi:hypothetical protein